MKRKTKEITEESKIHHIDDSSIRRKILYKETGANFSKQRYFAKQLAKGLCTRCNNKLFTKHLCKKHRDITNKLRRVGFYKEQ